MPLTLSLVAVLAITVFLCLYALVEEPAVEALITRRRRPRRKPFELGRGWS